MKLLLSLNLFG
jgi:hypothetical protein